MQVNKVEKQYFELSLEYSLSNSVQWYICNSGHNIPKWTTLLDITTCKESSKFLMQVR
jgi:hypothetical protein